MKLIYLFLFSICQAAFGSVETWSLCRKDTDCKDTSNKCCQAHDEKKIDTEFLCGPPGATTVAYGTSAFGGHSFDCGVQLSANAKKLILPAGAILAFGLSYFM